MTYWLQELQQKRWEYCNGLDMVKWDSGTSPTPGDFSQGLVARDTTGESQVEGSVSLLCVVAVSHSKSAWQGNSECHPW